MKGRFPLLAPLHCVVALLFTLALPFVPAANAADTIKLLVKFRTGVGVERAQSILADAGARDLSQISQVGVHVVSVPSARAEQVRAALARRDGVDFAEQDGERRVAETVPNDYWWPNQWAPQKARVTRAWDVTSGDPSVVIAVLDTGVTAVPDLTGNLLAGYDTYSNDSDPTDEYGHGTNVAAVAAGRSSNGVGVAGVCGRCSILPVKVGGPDGTIPWSASAAGITWAADHGADVINMSYAGPTSSSTESSAVQYAMNKGVVVVASAGNYSSSSPYYPAAQAGVVGVASTEPGDTLSSYSNYGSWVAVAAPGCSRAAQRTGTYSDFCGTSSAAPFVAGVAGLVRSATPVASGTQVVQALQSSAVGVGSFVRYGRVDAWGALAALGVPWSGNSGAPQSAMAPTFVAQGGGPLTAAPTAGQWIGGTVGGWTGAAGMTFSWQWRRCDPAGANCVAVGSGSSYQVASGDLGKTIRVAVTSSNGSGSASAVSAPLSVGGTATGSAPQSTVIPAISGTAQAGQTLAASTGTWSGAPTAYAYQWRRCSTSGTTCVAIAGATASSYTAAAADVGSTLSVVVAATNAYGTGSATSASTPVVTSAAGGGSVQETFTGNLTARTSSLSYATAVGAGDASATLTWSGGKSAGMTLTLLDASGATVASASGSSGLQLTRPLAAGSYHYVVSGQVTKGSTSFTLSVLHPS